MKVNYKQNFFVEPSYSTEMNFISKATSGSGQDQRTAVAKSEALGNELYRLSCTVKWSWGDNKLLSVKATPSYKIKSSRYNFEGYSHPVDIEKDNNTAEIYVQGHFTESWTGGMNFKHHYASLSIVVDKKGQFAYVPVTE